MKIKVIYIAGPYRAPTTMGVADNIRAAERIGMIVAESGAMPLIPHANTGIVFTGVSNDMFWLAGTLELMRRCDGVVLMDTWARSTGARGEREEALRLGLPVLDLAERRMSIARWIASIEPKALG